MPVSKLSQNTIVFAAPRARVSQPLAGLPSQSPKPTLQVYRHDPSAAQLGLAFGRAEQLVQLAPQPHPPPQGVKVGSHVYPHETPSHVAVPFMGAGQGAQEVPQLEVDVSSAHDDPHAWYPPSQETPQLVPSHVGLPFGGSKHAVQDDPQLEIDVFGTQEPPQR
ncbi:MAG: hypothetical protein H6834_18445 [Planctomycetes bacterium]|nr:hypothetical protein [Planctomycetota bacterium]